jgi:hypothetical protein
MNADALASTFDTAFDVIWLHELSSEKILFLI